MDTIKITTPENVEITYRLAGVASRTAAAVLDFLILGLLIAIVAFIAFFTMFGFTPETIYFRFINGYNPSSYIAAICLISVFVIYFGYFIISEMAMKGQSIGKKILKLRVIRENGRPVTIGQSLVRNLLRYFVDIYGFGVAAMYFSKNAKRIGDMAAGTVVIAENPNEIMTESLLSPLEKTENTMRIDAQTYVVTAEELNMLLDYFKRRGEFLDGGEAIQQHLFRYFAKKFNVEYEKFTYDILKKIADLNLGHL